MNSLTWIQVLHFAIYGFSRHINDHKLKDKEKEETLERIADMLNTLTKAVEEYDGEHKDKVEKAWSMAVPLTRVAMHMPFTEAIEEMAIANKLAYDMLDKVKV